MIEGPGDEGDFGDLRTAKLFGGGGGTSPHGATAEQTPMPGSSGSGSGGTLPPTQNAPTDSRTPPSGPATPPASGIDGPIVPGQTIFGKYVVERQLGRGGMGTVWLVRHRELEIERAVKLIVPSFAIDPEIRARFRREARVMAKFSHPNAVAVHDALLSNDIAFIEMEYVRGESLNRLMTPGNPMPLDWIARILAQLCDVLQLAHDQNIVHRDLKPSNLMLLDGLPPGQEHLKVLDFGIAKILGAEGEGEEEPATEFRTRPGHFIGTAQYSSPEQVSEGRVDGRSDLYAVGVMLYEFLTGSRPFTGPAVMYNHCHVPPPPFAKTNPAVELPPEIEAVVLRCLAKSPEARPQTAHELAEEFFRALPPVIPRPHFQPIPSGHNLFPTPPTGFPPSTGTSTKTTDPHPGTSDKTWVKGDRSRTSRPLPGPVAGTARQRWKAVARGLGVTVAVAGVVLAAAYPRAPSAPKIETILETVTPPKTDIRENRGGTRGADHFVPIAGFQVAEDAGGVGGWPGALLCRKDGSRLVLIAGGTFMMGHMDKFGTFLGDEDEPAHPVTLPSYYMQEAEVTHGQMLRFFADVDPPGSTTEYQTWHKAYLELLRVGVKEEEAKRHPATMVSHRTAGRYAEWAGGRLPSEAQWEYAARSRGQERLYVWPENLRPGNKLANIDSVGEIHAPNEEADLDTMQVKSYEKDRTDQGVFDLTGNVREWCRDVWGLYHTGQARPPTLPPGQAPVYVVRGGCFHTPPDEFRTTGPRGRAEDQAAGNIGFRIVAEVPQGAE